MVEWHDLIRGPQHIDTSTLSDPVLVREDGTYLYTLPSVIDDINTASRTSSAARTTWSTPQYR